MTRPLFDLTGGDPAQPVPIRWVLAINAPIRTEVSKKTRRSRLVAAWLTMNTRERHWGRRADLVAEWRNLATAAAVRVRLPRGRVVRARFDVELRFARVVRRDPPNWHPTAKAVVDALTRGTRTHPGWGFLPDDSPRYLHCEECPHLRIGRLFPARAYGPQGQLVLTITDLTHQPAAEPCRSRA